MHVKTDVLRGSQSWLPAMHPDPNANLVILWPVVLRKSLLQVASGRYRLASALKSDKKGVTLTVHLVATVTVERPTQKRTVNFERLSIRRRP
jgi:hypothetical protein